MKRPGLSFLMVLITSVISIGQEIEVYTVSDGLAGTDVTAICADDNYLWLATNGGLCRFDGKNFRTYRSDGTMSLAENRIETMIIDSKGLMWIGYKTGGVDIFDARHNTVNHLEDIVGSSPLRVMTILEDSRGNIWLGTWEDGLYCLKSVGDGGYEMSHHYPSNTVSSLLEKPAGKLWIGTYYGYFLYDIDSGKDMEINDRPYAVTHLLDAGERNCFLMSTWSDGIRAISWKDGFVNVHSENVAGSGDDFYCMNQGEASNIYLASWGDGVKILDRFSNKIKGRLPIDASVVMSFYKDKYDRLWIGTYGDGLYCIKNTGRGISSLPLSTDGTAPVVAIKQPDSGRLLVGTRGDGLYNYDIADHSFSRGQSLYENFFSRSILSLYTDDEVTVVGNDDTGILYIPSGNTHEAKKYDYDKNFGKVTAIYRDLSGVFWLGTKQSGLYSLVYNSVTQTFESCTHYEIPGSNEITGICRTGRNELWIASHGGLLHIEPSTSAISYIPETGSLIYSMAVDQSAGLLWLGTSSGLRYIDYEKEPATAVKAYPDLLPEESVGGMALDAEGNLWFTISNRIYCRTAHLNDVRELNLHNKRPQMIHTVSPCVVDGRRCVLFGCNDCLLVVDPVEALGRPGHTKILFTGLSVNHQRVEVGESRNGRVILEESPEYISSVTLSYFDRWIELSFAEVGWDNYQNSYQYRIKGLSDEWSYFDISKPLSLSQLNPGKYLLSIRPATQLTAPYLDDESVFQLELIIRPPWWKTTWFYIIVIIITVGILWSSVLLTRRHYRLIQLRRLNAIEKRKQEEVLQEKENFFTGLSHDLLTSFSLIMAPTVDLLRDGHTTVEQKEKLKIVYRNAEFLSDIFKSILDFKRAEVSDVRLVRRHVDIIAYIRMAVSAFSYQARNKGVELCFEQPERDELMVDIDIIKFERILYNIVSNAVKYTLPGGTVSVRLKKDPKVKSFSVIVEDSGIGVKSSDLERVFEKFYRGDNSQKAPGLGLGLYTASRFARAMGGDIVFESVENKGTIVTMIFPCGESIENAINEESNNDQAVFNVLVVEDNTQMSEYLKKKLSSNFEVTIAKDGAEALDLIHRNMPELVISDVMMPRMDGLELCRAVKNNHLLSDIFFVILSAKSSPEDEVAGYEAGADLYLKKPFDPDMLISQMKNLYNTRLQRRKQIIASMLEPESDKPSETNNFIERALEVMEEHIMDENFRLEEFAAAMGISKTVLNRKFKTLVGETPNTFIRNVRLRKAAIMLKTTDYSISEIAYMTGFAQAHYFIKRFKELYNETPGTYRQRETNKPIEDE